MSSFLFNTFINLYLGLVVSYNRDLYPQYNFSTTASWWGSMLSNSFKFKPALWQLANSKSEGGPKYNWIAYCFGGKQD